MVDKIYIGDGVYAEYDEYHIILTTDGNKIFLDTEVFRALVEYGKTVGMIKE